MNDPSARATLQQIGRELAHAQQALDTPGAGAEGTLACRVADLQQRLLTTPAASLDDLASRMEVIRALVTGLGPRGYLLDLVEATLADLQRFAAERTTASDPPARR